jgi:hypothetical protein
MFVIRDYEGFEFVVDSFHLQGFEAVGSDFQKIIKPIKISWNLDQVTKMSINGQLIGMMTTKTMSILNAI